MHARRRLAADDPAWVIVGYPRYAPEIVDIITLDDLVFDVAVRNFALVPYMYGMPPFDGSAQPPDDLDFWRRNARWNRAYRPYFWRDIWPILQRPNDYAYVMDRNPLAGGNPHSQDPGGNFDPTELSIPPFEGEDSAARERRRLKRQFLYGVLRKQGQENELYTEPDGHSAPLLFRMPLLCGDNPISNTVPAKFLRLTDTMLFLLRQWADGLFINERREGIDPGPQLRGPGAALDRAALASGLGGSFCPGGEASWIMRNPAIYASAYRIHHSSYSPGGLSQPGALPGGAPSAAANMANGLEPGDLTKYSAVPWQSDFNECTTQTIDITYQGVERARAGQHWRSGRAEGAAHVLVAGPSAGMGERRAVVADGREQCRRPADGDGLERARLRRQDPGSEQPGQGGRGRQRRLVAEA